MSYVAQLRQETVARLSDVPAFKKVFDSRQAQIRRTDLPALRVYTSQNATGRSINIPDFLTTTSLVVQIVADDITDARSAERVDDLCDAVKDRLLGDAEWLQLYEQITGISTEVDRNIEGEQRTTVATLTFDLTVSEWWEPRVPDTLEHIHVDVDVITPAADPNLKYPGPDGRIEAVFDVHTPPQPAKD
jgi:hypothetical protein